MYADVDAEDTRYTERAWHLPSIDAMSARYLDGMRTMLDARQRRREV
jgi:hypothetical protein